MAKDLLVGDMYFIVLMYFIDKNLGYLKKLLDV